MRASLRIMVANCGKWIDLVVWVANLFSGISLAAVSKRSTRSVYYAEEGRKLSYT